METQRNISSIWIEEASKKIESRIQGFSVPTIREAVFECTKSDEQTELTVSACTAALRGVYFLDFHAESFFGNSSDGPETNAKQQTYLEEAQRQFALCYSFIPDKEFIPKLETQKIMFEEFFRREKLVWEKVVSKNKIEEKEIMDSWKLKSIDAVFYGKIINHLTGKNFSPVLYSNMRLLDIRGDLMEPTKDLLDNSPNMTVAMLARKIDFDLIPRNDSEIMQLVRNNEIDQEILGIVDGIKNRISRYDNIVAKKQNNLTFSNSEIILADTFSDYGIEPQFNGYMSVRRRMDDNENWIKEHLLM